jgi:hypothetical protein
MYDMTKLLQLHQIIDVNGFWLADTIDIVPSEIDQHDVLCAIFFGSEKLGSKSVVLYNASTIGEKEVL